MFNGIVGVLNEKASKIFRFKEQEQLHEEIIDTGLAKIYQSHLEIGRKLAAEDGVELSITLLDGKCFEKILTFARKEQPWLLIMGRVGVHSDENETDLGSNTENLLRLAPCNVLLTGGKFYPPLDVKAEEIISWTEEAEARMERVPPQVKGVARTALLRYAIEQGHTVITNKVIDEAMAIFMPTRMAEKMQIMAEDLAVAKLRADNQVATAICSICGYTVKGPNPVVTCPVCKAAADKFQIISRDVVEAIATQEGGIEEEESMPGVQVKWSADARDALREVEDAYLRRRAKARVEKYARSKKIPVITTSLALPMIEETVGREKLGAGWDTLLAKTTFEPAQAPAGETAPASPLHVDRRRDRAAQPRAGGVHARHDARGSREGRRREGRDHHRSRGVRGRHRPRARDDERGHRGVRLAEEAACSPEGGFAPLPAVVARLAAHSSLPPPRRRRGQSPRSKWGKRTRRVRHHDPHAEFRCRVGITTALLGAGCAASRRRFPPSPRQAPSSTRSGSRRGRGRFPPSCSSIPVAASGPTSACGPRGWKRKGSPRSSSTASRGAGPPSARSRTSSPRRSIRSLATASPRSRIFAVVPTSTPHASASWAFRGAPARPCVRRAPTIGARRRAGDSGGGGVLSDVRQSASRLARRRARALEQPLR